MSAGVSAMPMGIDMATALELPLGMENEAKFVALRNLQLKKIKQLMNALDSKDKEIAKLKILSKDNRRTQMIQALRDKVRDLELINDVVKEELVRRAESSLAEVNELIMKKTLGGPKRFRPLTREEMENKIIDLEKKLERTANKRPAEAKESAPSSSQTQTQTQTQTRTSASFRPNSITNAGNETMNAENDQSAPAADAKRPSSMLDAALLVDEVQRLKATVGAKDSIINTLRDDIVRLRARNAELAKAEEDAEFLEGQCADLRDENAALSHRLQDLGARLAEAMETANKYQNEAGVVQDYEQSELSSLQQQCEKLLKQNATLLKNLANAENVIEKYEKENMMSKQRTNSVESTVQSQDTRIHTLEDKLAKSEERVRQLEAKCAALEKEAEQVPTLKNQLREKNIALKEIKRNMEEREKILLLRSSSKAIPTANDLLLDADGKSSTASLLAEEKELRRSSANNSAVKL